LEILTRSNRQVILATIEVFRNELQTRLEEDKELVSWLGMEEGQETVCAWRSHRSWSGLHHGQFLTAVEHNCWTRQDRSMYLITALQGRANDI
jgi:hypothetical protein